MVQYKIRLINSKQLLGSIYTQGLQTVSLSQKCESTPLLQYYQHHILYLDLSVFCGYLYCMCQIFLLLRVQHITEDVSQTITMQCIMLLSEEEHAINYV